MPAAEVSKLYVLQAKYVRNARLEHKLLTKFNLVQGRYQSLLYLYPIRSSGKIEAAVLSWEEFSLLHLFTPNTGQCRRHRGTNPRQCGWHYRADKQI